MSLRPISVRLFSLVMVLGLFGMRAWAQAQPRNISQSSDPAGYRIAGTGVSKVDGHPLARARIFIRQARDQHKFQSMLTSDDGKFEFRGLPAGKYSLEGTKRGYISAGYDQHDQFSTAIVTGAGIDTEGQNASSRGIDRSLDVAYPVTYYADVTDADSA